MNLWLGKRKIWLWHSFFQVTNGNWTKNELSKRPWCSLCYWPLKHCSVRRRFTDAVPWQIRKNEKNYLCSMHNKSLLKSKSNIVKGNWIEYSKACVIGYTEMREKIWRHFSFYGNHRENPISYLHPNPFTQRFFFCKIMSSRPADFRQQHIANNVNWKHQQLTNYWRIRWREMVRCRHDFIRETSISLRWIA